MSAPTRPIVIVFAFANDRVDDVHYLRNLPEEQRRLREVMAPAVRAEHCELLERNNVTLKELIDALQDARGRVAVLHYGGHAAGSELFLESPDGAPDVAHSAGIAALLEHQLGLELVFLNGCSTAGQVRGLLAAGVPAVVATSQNIDDEVATDFAARFYRGLASGASLRTAFHEAEAALCAHLGDPARAYRNTRPREVSEEIWPWELYVALGPSSGSPPGASPRRLGIRSSAYRRCRRWICRPHRSSTSTGSAGTMRRSSSGEAGRSETSTTR